MFVPVVRTSLEAGEPLKLQAIVLGTQPLLARIYWRGLGGDKFNSQPLTHVARGVYEVEVPATQLAADFEYYVEKVFMFFKCIPSFELFP